MMILIVSDNLIDDFTARVLSQSFQTIFMTAVVKSSGGDAPYVTPRVSSIFIEII